MDASAIAHRVLVSIVDLAAIWQGRERPGGEVDLTRITTTSLPALKAFLEGERQ